MSQTYLEDLLNLVLPLPSETQSTKDQKKALEDFLNSNN